MSLPRVLVDAYQARKITVLVGSGASVAKDVAGSFPRWHETPERFLLQVEYFSALLPGIIAQKRLQYRSQTSLEVLLAELDVLKSALGRDYESAIRTIFRPVDALPGALHRAIVALDVPALVTTNYDKLLEYADPTRQVYTWKDSAKVHGDLKHDRNVLFKVHGTAEHHDSLILTKGEYQALNEDASYKSVFRYLLESTSLLCIGYGMEDPMDIDRSLAANADAFQSSANKHFLFLKEATQKDVDRYKRDLNVHVIPYASHEDLPVFLQELSGGAAPPRSVTTRGSYPPASALAPSDPGHVNLARALADARLAGFSTIDDAVKICDLHFDATEIQVSIARPRTPDDELDGEYSVDTHALRWKTWARDFDGPSGSVGAFLERRLHALLGRKGPHACKVGFVEFDATATAGHGDTLFTVRPVNHLITEAFNRGLALERLFAETHPVAEVLWRDCARQLLSGANTFRMMCPSQLFIELAVITTDGWVSCAKKAAFNSIYTRRNHGTEVWTCGVEYGPRWTECIRPIDGADRAMLSLRDAVLDALAWEYQIRAASSNRGSPKLPADSFLACDVQQARIRAFAVQGIHLNAALLGYCVLPITREALATHLGTRSAHGLNFRDLHFLHLDECAGRVKTYEHTTSWHGTALMRLQVLVDHRVEIDNDLATS